MTSPPSVLRRRRSLMLALGVAVAAAIPALTGGSAGAASTAVNLRTAADFSVLASSTVTNTGPSTLGQSLGIHPGTALTGFLPGIIGGETHLGDGVALQAKSDLDTAFNDAAGRTPFTNVRSELGGSLLTPGVYRIAAAQLTGTLTLNAQGDPAAVFIFQVDSTLITASNSAVRVINQANPCNITWKVGSSATLGTGTSFVGNVLAHESITAQTGANVQGRLLAQTAAVTLDTNAITAPICEVPSTTTSLPTTTAPASTTSAGPTTTTTAPASTTVPATTAPATTVPATTAPATTVPATTAPATTAPATTVPATTAPATTAPATTAPATTVPATTAPATTAPATTAPATTAPATTVPATTVPATTVPATTQPASTVPPVTTAPKTTAPQTTTTAPVVTTPPSSNGPLPDTGRGVEGIARSFVTTTTLDTSVIGRTTTVPGDTSTGIVTSPGGGTSSGGTTSSGGRRPGTSLTTLARTGADHGRPVVAGLAALAGGFMLLALSRRTSRRAE